MRKVCLIFLTISLFSTALLAGTMDTTIAVNTTVTVNTFKPFNVFGNNTNGWTNPVAVKDKIQGAGNYLSALSRRLVGRFLFLEQQRRIR